jgi:hypothetical protein
MALFGRLVDCGLIYTRPGGSLQSGRDFLALELFSKGKYDGLDPRQMNHAAQPVHHEPRTRGGEELTRAWPHDRSGSWHHSVTEGKQRGGGGDAHRQ